MANKKPNLSHGPHVPAVYDLADVSAIQALHRGDASSDQQQRALKWLIERASNSYDFHFYPSDRDTAFALGRGFVGQQIVKLLKLDVSSLRRQANETTTSAHPAK